MGVIKVEIKLIKTYPNIVQPKRQPMQTLIHHFHLKHEETSQITCDNSPVTIFTIVRGCMWTDLTFNEDLFTPTPTTRLSDGYYYFANEIWNCPDSYGLVRIDGPIVHIYNAEMPQSPFEFYSTVDQCVKLDQAIKWIPCISISIHTMSVRQRINLIDQCILLPHNIVDMLTF
jgi:hypothetical protein